MSQGSEYGFWMYTQGLRRVPNMSDYDSIRLNNALMSEYALISRNISEYG